MIQPSLHYPNGDKVTLTPGTWIAFVVASFMLLAGLLSIFERMVRLEVGVHALIVKSDAIDRRVERLEHKATPDISKAGQ